MSVAKRIAEGWLTPLPPEMQSARVRFPREVLLARIAADIRALFPGRVERLVLYGSRARGEARDEGFAEDSDWDVAVFLRDRSNQDRNRVADWAYDLWLETGWDVQAQTFPERGWEERTIFMFGLRRDAVDL